MNVENLRERLEKRLITIAEEQSVIGGFVFGEVSRTLLRDLISRGIEKIEGEGKLDTAAAHFEAKMNMMKLVDAMVAEARESAEDTEALELGERTFTGTLGRFASLWPYS